MSYPDSITFNQRTYIKKLRDFGFIERKYEVVVWPRLYLKLNKLLKLLSIVHNSKLSNVFDLRCGLSASTKNTWVVGGTCITHNDSIRNDKLIKVNSRHCGWAAS